MLLYRTRATVLQRTSSTKRSCMKRKKMSITRKPQLSHGICHLGYTNLWIAGSDIISLSRFRWDKEVSSTNIRDDSQAARPWFAFYLICNKIIFYIFSHHWRCRIWMNGSNPLATWPWPSPMGNYGQAHSILNRSNHFYPHDCRYPAVFPVFMKQSKTQDGAKSR